MVRIAVFTCVMMAGVARAEDWPRWRGPLGDGISREAGLVDAWPEAGPKKLWSAMVGVGFSSPVVVGGRVYIFTLVDDQAETLHALDAQSGQVLWAQAHEGGWAKRSYPGSRATPTIEDDRIYTFGGRGDLICRMLADGKQIWHVNVMEATGVTKTQEWGLASSPLIVGNLIYVQNGVGGPIAVAVNKADGKLVWQSEAKGLAGYAHPILVDVSGTKQLIVFGGDAVHGIDPADGRTIWSEPWQTKYDVNATTPVYRDGHLLVTSGYDSGAMMLRLSATGAEKLWAYRDARGHKHIKSRFPGVVLDHDVLYANCEGILRAMSWPDGKILWETRAVRFGTGGSFVRHGERLIGLSERGELMLVKATADGAEKVAGVKIDDGNQNWATPTVSGGRLYVKTTEALHCFDVSAGSVAAH